MAHIEVIGPVGSVYHLGYRVEGDTKFYSINEFTNKGLAEAMAVKMNYDASRTHDREVDHGR